TNLHCRIAGLPDCRKGRQEGLRSLPSCNSAILQFCKSPQLPVVDDADDAGVDRWLGGMEWKARLFAADEEHFLADAGTDRVHRDERPPRRLTLRGQRLDDEQLDRGEPLVLAGHHDVTDTSR